MSGTRIDDILASAEELDARIEYPKHMPPLPIEIEIIQDTTYLPGVAEFKQFFDELNTFGMSTIETGNGTVKITSGAGKTVVFGIRGIAELVADKLKMPIPIDTDQEITFAGKPNFVENVDALLNSKMEWVKVEFKEILKFNDSRIEKLCQDYHKLHSIPIIALIDYLKWKWQYISYLLQAETIRIQDKKASEIREIRNEYKEKLDEEKAKLLKRAEAAEGNFSRLREGYERDRKLLLSTQGDVNTQKGEIEELHRKYREAEKKATDMESKYFEAQVKLKEAQAKLCNLEKNEWIQSPTMSQQPAFKNEATKEVFNFPCTIEKFKENYQLIRTIDGFDIFETKDHKELKIPEGLLKKISQSPQQAEQQEIISKGKKLGKKETELKVLKAIQDSDEPLSIPEIEAISRVASTNLSGRHLKNLLKSREIIMEKGVDGIQRYSIP